MKHYAPQHEMDFGREPFRLIQESAPDHARVAQEEAQRMADAAESGSRQSGLDFDQARAIVN